MIQLKKYYQLQCCGIIISCFLTTLIPRNCLSKTIYYDYSSFGYLRQAQTVSGPVFDYTYDPIGNRKTMTISPLDSDDDGLSNIEEISHYGSDPYLADTDGDGVKDGDEVNYWGTNWNSDFDNDGLINLLDRDADGDGFGDGFEISHGTNPADPSNYPPIVLVPIIFMMLDS